MSFDNLQADPEVQRLVLLSKLEENVSQHFATKKYV